MDNEKKGIYAGNFIQSRAFTPLTYRPNARTLEIILKKPEFSQNSPDSFRSTPKTSRKLKIFKELPPGTSRSLSRSANPERVKELISNLMNRKLGIKVLDEVCTPQNTNIAKFYQLREKRDLVKIKNDGTVGFITDPLHYKSEYLNYLFDVGKNVLMEKYIGQNLLKKRKQMKFLNGFNKL